jgi:hypothetical protein
LSLLKQDQNNDFSLIITGTESWFYFDCHHQSVWVLSRDEVAERVKQKIGTEKRPISVA